MGFKTPHGNQEVLASKVLPYVASIVDQLHQAEVLRASRCEADPDDESNDLQDPYPLGSNWAQDIDFDDQFWSQMRDVIVGCALEVRWKKRDSALLQSTSQSASAWIDRFSRASGADLNEVSGNLASSSSQMAGSSRLRRVRSIRRVGRFQRQPGSGTLTHSLPAMRSTSNLDDLIRRTADNDEWASEQDSVATTSDSDVSDDDEDDMYRRARASLISASSSSLLPPPTRSEATAPSSSRLLGRSSRRLTGSHFSANHASGPAAVSRSPRELWGLWMGWSDRVRLQTSTQIEQVNSVLEWYKDEHMALSNIESSLESRQARHQVEDIIIKLADTVGEMKRLSEGGASNEVDATPEPTTTNVAGVGSGVGVDEEDQTLQRASRFLSRARRAESIARRDFEAFSMRRRNNHRMASQARAEREQAREEQQEEEGEEQAEEPAEANEDAEEDEIDSDADVTGIGN